jgi:glycosyltransferase involved in cell wall biosynthesis
MTRILVYARGAVGSSMGSPGVRAYHMARVLAEQLPGTAVTLATPNTPDIEAPHPRVRFATYANPWAGLRHVLQHDIIICRNFPPGFALLFPQKRLVLDFYAYFFIEWLSMARQRIPDRRRRRVWGAANRYYLDFQLTMADYIACAEHRQRDAWIGALAALGLVPPRTYERDRTLRRLIDVVPYGVQPGSPRPTRRVLKGVIPGIRETDTVLVWNGSIMEWFDAKTVIRAMAKVSAQRDDIKLFFLGTEHPDWVTGVLLSPPREAVELSRNLGLTDRSVFFNVGWVPYAEIGNYLAEADLGVCAGFDSAEERYAFRTRYVDCFWAELPIVHARRRPRRAYRARAARPRRAPGRR